MNNSKQDQPSTKASIEVVVGRKIWAEVNIVTGDVNAPE